MGAAPAAVIVMVAVRAFAAVLAAAVMTKDPSPVVAVAGVSVSQLRSDAAVQLVLDPTCMVTVLFAAPARVAVLVCSEISGAGCALTLTLFGAEASPAIEPLNADTVRLAVPV